MRLSNAKTVLKSVHNLIFRGIQIFSLIFPHSEILVTPLPDYQHLYCYKQVFIIIILFSFIITKVLGVIPLYTVTIYYTVTVLSLTRK